MSIRITSQDHLKERASPLELVPQDVQDEVEAELVFSTENDVKPGVVDLREFFYGGSNSASPRWSGNFRARPMLILQLAPAIREHWNFITENSVRKKIQHLRKWFRLLDACERKTADGTALRPVDSVEDFSEIHGQFANEKKFTSAEFGALRSVVDTTRAALGLPQLFWAWQGDKKIPIRDVPLHAGVAAIFHELKRRWFGALDRWERVETLCKSHKNPDSSDNLVNLPRDADEEYLLRNCVHYRNQIAYEQGRALLSNTERIRAGMTPLQFKRKNLHSGVMLRGHFPDVHDVRAAFHLCLLGSGWNPQTLLDLPVELSEEGDPKTPFLKNHPTNPTRYVMRGHKMRGRTDPPSVGDWKTSRSPGAVIRKLVEQTAPIRRSLQIEARRLEELISQKALKKERQSDLMGRLKEVASLISSPWLYVEPRGIVCALTEKSYYQNGFLQSLIDEINVGKSPQEKVEVIVATDLRDAYASFALGLYGGSIRAVRFALHHRSLRSTNPYLVNRLLSKLAQSEFLKFENFLWLEILQRGKVDPTALAKLVRDGKMTSRERFRLRRYRDLRLSRLHMHCRQPTEPPKRVDPNFMPDGKSQCVAQRCLLCYEHAAISAESINGICMRKAELIHLKGQMSIQAFTSELFQEEDENADSVLSMFPPDQVSNILEIWQRRIARGEHRVIEFVGIQGSLRARS